MTWTDSVISILERINEYVGRAISWLVLAMVLTAFAVATLRYGFRIGWVWMQESYIWMHGTIIMLAAGYTLLHDGHVRVDVIYRALSVKARAWIDLLGVLFFLMPTLAVAGWMILPYVLLSWRRLEISLHPSGLPGLFLWKTTMLLFVVLLALQGLVIIIKSIRAIRSREAPPAERTLPGEGV